MLDDNLQNLSTMIIVDSALRKLETEKLEIKVAMVGAGFMAKAVAYQICKFTPGILLVAISNRNVDKAKITFQAADVLDAEEVSCISGLEKNIRLGIPSVTNNPLLLTAANGIDAIIEVTGTVEFSAKVTMNALLHKKHVILMNAALDATLGPILSVYAQKAGVVLTNVDGNPAGSSMNLYRYVKSLGIEPVFCGSMDNQQSSMENPASMQEISTRFGQNAQVASSFADGSKSCFEQAILANATGMRLCEGESLTSSSIKDVLPNTGIKLLGSEERYNFPNIVDHLLAADSDPGVFVLATTEDPYQQHYLSQYQVADKSLYMFKMPFQMCHFEVANTIAKAVINQDAAITPLNKPCVEVVATAKRDIKAGEILDGIGGYLTYGISENADDCQQNDYLPLGIAENCILKHNVSKDQVLTYNDVILPEGRLIDKLRQEQNNYFTISTGMYMNAVHK
jgi:predicted homoserine dehydrogenase-like protein